VTAHHADDVVETIAINLIRGTGWRGLAVLNSPDIWRPLLPMRKADIISYAKKHELTWREDQTNSDTKYLRNDLRQKLANIDASIVELLNLYRNRQVFLKREIDSETSELAESSPYSRYFLIMLPHPEALELLRTVLTKDTGYTPTRPQLDRALLAVKVLDGGKRYEVGAGINLILTKTHYVVEDTTKVLS
jgi:tRNA(Ile)-lysidine synthase